MAGACERLQVAVVYSHCKVHFLMAIIMIMVIILVYNQIMIISITVESYHTTLKLRPFKEKVKARQ